MTTTEAIWSVIRGECSKICTSVLGNISASGLKVLAMRAFGCARALALSSTAGGFGDLKSTKITSSLCVARDKPAVVTDIASFSESGNAAKVILTLGALVAIKVRPREDSKMVGSHGEELPMCKKVLEPHLLKVGIPSKSNSTNNIDARLDNIYALASQCAHTHAINICLRGEEARRACRGTSRMIV